MKKTLSALLLFTCVLHLTNCASITSPERQQVKVNSVPAGAQVTIGNKMITTPAIVALKGKSEYVAIAKKDGYRDTTDVLGSKVRILPSIVGNIFNLTGFLGAAVDFLGTGAAYKLDPELTIQLQP